MLQRMKRAALLVLLFAGSAAAGTVYKYVGPDGVTIYSDRQVPGAIAVDLPESSTYAPREMPATSPASGEAVEEPLGGVYETLAIVEPANEGTVRSNEGRVDVSVTLQPAIQDGHTLSFLLDGNEIAKGLRSTRFRLTDVERGEHRLEASVYDAEGGLLARSRPIRFFLQKASVAEKLRAAEEAAQEERRRDQEKQTRDQWADYEKKLKDFKAAQPPEGPNELPPTPPSGTPPLGYGGVFQDYKNQLTAYRKARGVGAGFGGGTRNTPAACAGQSLLPHLPAGLYPQGPVTGRRGSSWLMLAPAWCVEGPALPELLA